MKFHPYCELFPLHEDVVDELAESMEAHGWAEGSVVTTYQGMILDGRHRWMAAERVGVVPVVREFEGSDQEALRLVLRENLSRRHLSSAEKREVLRRMREEGIWERNPHGTNQYTEMDGSNGPSMTQEELASLLGVGYRTIKRWDAEHERVPGQEPALKPVRTRRTKPLSSEHDPTEGMNDYATAMALSLMLSEGKWDRLKAEIDEEMDKFDAAKAACLRLPPDQLRRLIAELQQELALAEINC